MLSMDDFISMKWHFKGYLRVRFDGAILLKTRETAISHASAFSRAGAYRKIAKIADLNRDNKNILWRFCENAAKRCEKGP